MLSTREPEGGAAASADANDADGIVNKSDAAAAAAPVNAAAPFGVSAGTAARRTT